MHVLLNVWLREKLLVFAIMLASLLLAVWLGGEVARQRGRCRGSVSG